MGSPVCDVDAGTQTFVFPTVKQSLLTAEPHLQPSFSFLLVSDCFLNVLLSPPNTDTAGHTACGQTFEDEQDGLICARPTSSETAGVLGSPLCLLPVPAPDTSGHCFDTQSR